MGRRKTRKRPVNTTIKQKVDTVFKCPFCDHNHVVEAKMDRDKKIGTIKCTHCTAHYQMVITDLTQPIDIYSEWIDECQNIHASGE